MQHKFSSDSYDWGYTPRKTNYGFSGNGSYRSPSTWWKDKLGSSSYDDEMFYYNPRGSAGDRTLVNNNFKLKKALYQLARVVNIVENSQGSYEETALKLRWADGEAINHPRDRFVTLSAKDYLNITDSDQALDMLTGQALTLSSMKRTMSVPAYTNYHLVREAEARGMGKITLPMKTALPLFETVETVKARDAVLNDWAGFSDYFRINQELSNTLKREQIETEVLPAAETSPVAFATLVGWNLLNPDNRVEFPTAMPDGTALNNLLQQVETMALSNTTPEQSFRHQISVGEFIIANLPEPPEPECEDEEDDDEGDSTGDGEDDSTGDGEGDSTGDGEGDSTGGTSGSGPKELDTEWKPSKGLVDNGLFGAKPEAVEGATGELSLDDKDLIQDNPMCHYDYYPDSEVPLDSLGVVRVKSNNAAEYRRIVQQNRNLIAGMKNALSFRATANSRWVHGMSEGELDMGALHKIAHNNPNIFSQRIAQSKPDLAITLLVDLSGSMDGQKSRDAKAVAIALTEALKGIKGVHVSVIGHTAQHDASDYQRQFSRNGFSAELLQEGSRVMISEFLTPDHDNPYALTAIDAHSSNYDGYAIEYAAKRQLKYHPEAKQRMVVVLSDGRPCNGNIHVRASVENARRKLGTQVYGIGVCNAYTPQDGEEMFGKGYSVVIDDVMRSLGILTPFLKNKLSKM